MDRISTGINGLDPLVDGGFPLNSVNLVTGGPGCGKTTFCVQFLYQGLKNGENCIYITTEETNGEIMVNAEQYGMQLDEFDNFEIRSIPPAQKIIGEIEWLLDENDFDRVVLDSLSVFEMYKDGDNGNVRGYIRDLIGNIRESDCTALLTTEIPTGSEGELSRYGVAEFVTDGVIKLDAEAMGSGVQRTITVRKMRATNIDGGIKDLSFAKDGLIVE